ncbi:seminal plasma protein A3-like [Balaenoptera musculus]|uniref:Seminal plasma protein A3-like n=1 Tax=Balaenoptera musculus TaxID=9771 RepID=A0A8B8VZ20_BALMU|nr:seminal plasma protein A3-like [Balaenoptera musculus]
MAPRLGIFLIWAGTSVFLQLDPVNGDQQLSENTTVPFAVTPDHETLRAEEANNAFLLSGNGCVFPFIYGGKTYFDCAIRGSIFRCCALNVDYIGRWKYCTRKDHAKRTFPFIYRGKIYESCTKTGSIFWRRWCSLSLNFDQDRAWRYC